MEQKYIYDKKSNKKRKAVEVICENCGNKFLKLLKNYKSTKHHFCCQECSSQFRNHKITIKCSFCGKEFKRTLSKLNSSKSKLYFCCKKCKDEAQKIVNGITEIQPEHYGSSLDYKTICFRHHPHKCCVCGEENIVAVHHYDENHNNNDICNLVPLCPTHHNYWHSRFRYLIQDIVDEYVKKFKRKNNK